MRVVHVRAENPPSLADVQEDARHFVGVKAPDAPERPWTRPCGGIRGQPETLLAVPHEIRHPVVDLRLGILPPAARRLERLLAARGLQLLLCVVSPRLLVLFELCEALLSELRDSSKLAEGAGHGPNYVHVDPPLEPVVALEWAAVRRFRATKIICRVQKVVVANAPKEVDHAEVFLGITRRDADEFFD